VIAWPVTKVTAVNINCIEPLNCDPHRTHSTYSFTFKHVISDTQTSEIIYNPSPLWEGKNIYNKQTVRT
jgi:hypothetical protein